MESRSLEIILERGDKEKEYSVDLIIKTERLKMRGSEDLNMEH